MPNGGKYVSHDHCWFPKIISSNSGPADCIAPPDHWNLANKESFWFNLLPAKRRKFWTFHCQNSSLDLCGPTMECQTAPHSLKICPGYWFSILYCQWHHLQPMSELIYNHENVCVALKNFTKRPHVQMRSISWISCLKVLQWSTWIPRSLIHTTFPTCGNVDVNDCSHSIPVSALADSLFGLLTILMSSNLRIMKELDNLFPLNNLFWNPWCHS